MTPDTRMSCCWRLIGDWSSHWLVVPKKPLLMVQGNRVHGHYYSFPKAQLEWQININDVTTQAEKEQAKIMQVRLSLSNSTLTTVSASSEVTLKNLHTWSFL